MYDDASGLTFDGGQAGDTGNSISLAASATPFSSLTGYAVEVVSQTPAGIVTIEFTVSEDGMSASGTFGFAQCGAFHSWVTFRNGDTFRQSKPFWIVVGPGAPSS